MQFRFVASRRILLALNTPIVSVASSGKLLPRGQSTVICAPVYSTHEGLSTQVVVRVEEGLKHPSSIHCDELVRLPKTVLTDFVGALSPAKLHAFEQALRAALEVED